MTKLIEAARKYIGQKEVKGPESNPWIKNLWMTLPGGKWFWSKYGNDDSGLPWCGAFVASACKDAGYDYPKNYASALAWAEWGAPLDGPRMGAVAVMTRAGGGHVGIVTGITHDRKLIRLLGGNQDDEVRESWFAASRITHYRSPIGESLDQAVIARFSAMNKSEA